MEQSLKKAVSRINRPDGSVLLLAVSKTQTAAKVREAYHYGLRAFGENYLQEAIAKQDELAELNIVWHFIGPIQSNKTRLVAERFDWVHSVDRLKIAERLSQQRPDHLPALNLCLQINIDNEPTKSGFSVSEIEQQIDAINALPNLRVRGFMVIPAARNSHADQLAIFQQVERLFLDLQHKIPTLDTLSMGMSNDMQAAVEAGSTIVRIGTALFGARAPKVQ